MSVLSTDLAAYTSALDPLSQAKALTQFLTDIVVALDAVTAQQAATTTADATAAATAVAVALAAKVLEYKLLASGSIWDPERMTELQAEGIDAQPAPIVTGLPPDPVPVSPPQL